MKKLLLILAFAGLINLSASAQRQHCFTSEYYNEAIANDPQWVLNQQALQTFTEQYSDMIQVQRQGNHVVLVIPVVFHILHDYGNENISDAQVYDAMEWLNRDYRKLNADTVYILPPFKPLAADCEIEFRLATLDPQGNCTNGIEHIATPKTYNADDNSKTDPNWMVWPNNKYLNIWVAHTLANVNAAAYAHLPGGSNATDGIMSRHNYVGSIGTSTPYNARTLTHEVGHHFNLLHVWGNTNDPGVACGDDFVNDTPISFGWDHCDTAGAYHCDTTILENVQNYMEYSYCDIMFTQGQKARMQACLASNVSQRMNLPTQNNLVETGTDVPGPGPICIPVADFKSEFFECAGTAIQFTDVSWKAPVSSRTWYFPGGNPSTSTDSMPLVTYSTPGLYDVTLVVGNSAGSDSITKVGKVRISGPPTEVMPYSEDFEDSTSFPGADAWVNNPDGFATWTRVTNTSAGTGTACIRMLNFNTTAGAKDEWITPSIDFSTTNFPIFVTFKVANAQRNSNTQDQLLLNYSLDCGHTWNGTLYFPQGPALSTVGIRTSNFTPAMGSTTEWRQESQQVNNVKLQPNVRFRFQNVSDHGNNTYIDEIFIYGNTANVDELDEVEAGFTLYPNPTQENTNVGFNLVKNSNVKIEVKNVMGQSVRTVIDAMMNAGQHQEIVPAMSAGIYFIELTVNGKLHIRKLVVS